MGGIFVNINNHSRLGIYIISKIKLLQKFRGIKDVIIYYCRPFSDHEKTLIQYAASHKMPSTGRNITRFPTLSSRFAFQMQLQESKFMPVPSFSRPIVVEEGLPCPSQSNRSNVSGVLQHLHLFPYQSRKRISLCQKHR